MIDGIITSIGEKIKALLQSTIGYWFSLDWIPEHYFWFWWLFVLFIVLGIILKFFGWIRVVQWGVSIVLAIGIVFVAGGETMRRRLDAAAAKRAARIKPKAAPKPAQPPTWPTWGSGR